MKTLNLTSPETSDIKFEVSHFPDGQQDVKILGSKFWELHPLGYKDVKIQSRFNSFADLELILCATKALRRVGLEEVHLYIPYLLGARSDRKFTDGGTSYLVDIVAPILNAQNYKSVTTLDAHSDVAAACINNLQVEDNEKLIAFAMYDLYPISWDTSKENCVLVSPDGGALKKIYHAADHLKYKGDVVICSKYRDTEGQLSRIEVPIRDSQIAKDFIIIDDICDGGRTFIEIAKVIKARANFTGNIYLIVTHFIGSSGYGELGTYFDAIYSTNSYKDVKVDSIGQQVESPGKHCVIKQLNIF